MNGAMVGCASGMPMYTKSSNTGVNVEAEVNLDEQNLGHAGALYQSDNLDDWAPPSGAMMWPGTFDNITWGSPPNRTGGIHCRNGLPSRRQGLPEVTGRVPGLVPDRC